MALLKKIGAIGDVHGEHEALKRVIDFLQKEQCERIVCLGDIVDGPGDVDLCLELLQNHQIDTIAGNHERWFLSNYQRSVPHATLTLKEENKQFLAQLPPTLKLDTVAGGLLACHGVSVNDMAFIYPDTRGYALQDIIEFRELMMDAEIQWMLGGHTHVRMVRAFQGITLINAGTLLRNHQPCFCILDFENKEVQFFNYDHDSFAISPSGIEKLQAIPLS